MEMNPERIHPQHDPAVIAAEDAAKKISTSKGEKLFDFLTYGGIAFAGVFIATMPFTYWTKYGGGKKFHDWMTTALKKRGASEHIAEQTFNTTVLGALGNAAVIPIKFLENKKPELVDKLNNLIGDKSHDASVEQDLKQSWLSLIKSRIAAYTAVFVSLQGAVAIFGGDKFNKFEENFAEHVICKPLGKPTHTPNLTKTVENETKAFRYGKIAALDVFATAAATILLYTSSRFFARKNEHWKAPHAELDAKANATPPVDTPPSIPEKEEVNSRVFTATIQPKPRDKLAPRQLASYTDTVNTKKTQQKAKEFNPIPT